MKILFSAFSCMPGFGSEHGVGWSAVGQTSPRRLMLPSHIRKCSLWFLLILCALALAAAASFPWLQAVGLAAILFPLLIALSRFHLTGLVIVFLICGNLVHFLKRAIFLFGPQPQTVYVGVQLLPTLVFAILFVAACRRRLHQGVPGSAKLLSLFLAVCLAVTWPSTSYVPWLGALTAVHQQLLPFLMFYVGLRLTLDEFAKAGRTLGALAVLSAIYGILQLITGPTVIDRVWAAESYSYSIHGSKVFDYVEGASPEFRAYSYYADPLTWGLFLVAGFIGTIVARSQSKLSNARWIAVVVLVLAGLFATMTRTCWASFLGTIGAYFLIRRRWFRNPWLAFGVVLFAFAAAIVGGTFLYREVFLARKLPIVQNPILARYITVGTIEARISAWEVLKEAVSQKPFGYGVMPYVRKRSEAPEWNRPLFSHNFLVELVLNAGVPGALLFFGFYLQWLREGFFALRKSQDRGGQRAILWIVAFSVGSMISGYFNGLNFMTYEFFLILGVLSGHAQRMAALERKA
jgi:hypothetical protein